MNQETIRSVFTNSAVAALAFFWASVFMAHWSRRHRPLHMVGALIMADISLIFLARGMIAARPPVLPPEVTTDVIGWMWLSVVLLTLIYSVLYLQERNFRVWPNKDKEL